MLKTIPQVHKSSNRLYWEIIFPSTYTNRQILTFPDDPDAVLDGDVHVDGANKLYCNRCNNNIHQLVPTMLGSIDVGYELCYKCPACDKVIGRIYSKCYVTFESNKVTT